MKDKSALADLVASKPGKLEKGFSPAAPDEGHAFRSVAKAFGIPAERMAAAESALRAFVKTCSAEKGYEDDDLDEL